MFNHRRHLTTEHPPVCSPSPLNGVVETSQGLESPPPANHPPAETQTNMLYKKPSKKSTFVCSLLIQLLENMCHFTDFSVVLILIHYFFLKENQINISFERIYISVSVLRRMHVKRSEKSLVKSHLWGDYSPHFHISSNVMRTSPFGHVRFIFWREAHIRHCLILSWVVANLLFDSKDKTI